MKRRVSSYMSLYINLYTYLSSAPILSCHVIWIHDDEHRKSNGVSDKAKKLS